MINKKFAFSYTFGAQLKIGDPTQIDEMAVVACSNLTEMAAKSLMHLDGNKKLEHSNFSRQGLGLNVVANY